MRAYPLGAKPPRNDPADYRAASLLPAATDLTYKMWDAPVVLDQGVYGTCVANAWTLLLLAAPLQHQERRLLSYDEQPRRNEGSSRYWPAGYREDPVAAELYALRLYDRIHTTYEPPDPERDDGAQTEDGARVLRDRGLVSAWYRARTADEVVTAILTHGPVVFASPWYRSMDDPARVTNDGPSPYFRCPVLPSSGIRGYHAYLLDVADTVRGYVSIHNSWGDGWGRGGRARITLEDLSVLFIGAAFIATEVPSA